MRSYKAVVVSVEYRLAPEDPYPAQINDCCDGFLWLQSQTQVLNIDPLKIGLYGQSAGGALVLPSL